MFGLLKENGPFLADIDIHGKPFVKSNPYRWSANHNVLYIDNPVGTGFSFTDSMRKMRHNQDDIAKDFEKFLRGFYEKYPEYQKNELFITGESFAGHYIPAIA